MDEPTSLVLLEQRTIVVEFVPIVGILRRPNVTHAVSMVAAFAPGPLSL